MSNVTSMSNVTLNMDAHVEQDRETGEERLVLTVPGVCVPTRHVLVPVLRAALDWATDAPMVRSVRVAIPLEEGR